MEKSYKIHRVEKVAIAQDKAYLELWQNAQQSQLPWGATLPLSNNESPLISFPVPWQSKPLEVIAGLLVYLSKILQQQEFSVLFSNSSLISQQVKSKEAFFPLNVFLNPKTQFQDVCALTEKNLNDILSKELYSPDFFLRHHEALKNISQIPCAIIETSSPNDVILPESVLLAFLIDSSQQSIHIKSKICGDYRSYIEDIPSQLELVLNKVLSDPSVSSQQIPLVIPQHATKGMSRQENSDNLHMCLHHVFEEQAEKSHHNTAVVFENKQVTYNALNKRANQLAHYLQDQGISIETKVAIALPRGIDLIVGIFGILKSGGVYIPLDITYPKDRLAYILDDSNAPFLLTLKGVELPKDYKGCVIFLDDSDIYSAYPSENCDVSIQPQNLAYITYTSGSTGRPKGVACDHRSVMNRMSWAWKEYPFEEGETCCLQSSIVFVDSTWDIFGTLLAGAKLILFKEEISRDVELLLKTCFHYKVTRITLIPSFMYTMLDYASQKLTQYKTYLRHWEITGESFQPELVEQFFKKIGGSQTLVDCYGATEVTSVIYRHFNPSSSFDYQTKTIDNTQFYLLDENLNLVPHGMPGEVHIAGLELARGYLNRSALTAERFIPNPFGEPGSRLYKTGDLARLRKNGKIEFVGRSDHQVKIRGYRIELGEIEGTLDSSKSVQQSVVLCREDAPGQKRLVAYIVPKESGNNDVIPSLQTLCQQRLPEYMQPSQWVVLDTFPLTSNGKIDRSALRAPEGREGLGKFEAPVGKIEQQLAAIWSDLLGLEDIGRNDDFFLLGGHSLIATQMVSRLRETLGIELPLKSVFTHRILSQLAQNLEASTSQGLILAPINPVNRSESHPLSFAQQRLWFLEQIIPDTALYHNPMCFKLKGNLHKEALRKALDAIVERHEVLRTIIQNAEGVASQVVLPANQGFPFHEDVSDLDAFVKVPFKLDSEPACRGALVKLNENEHSLVLVFHHIVVDDWSMDIFCKELNQFYQAFSTNHDLALDSLPVQYMDYSVWQRNWLQGEVLDKQLNYWQSCLKDVPRLALPTDFPRPSELTYKGGAIYRKLSDNLLEKLQEFSSSHGVTLFMTLLGSLQTFLGRYCNQNDIAIGTPIANRRTSNVEGLIGFFVNTLVIRSDLHDNPSFEDFMKRLEQTTLSAYEHQDVPFEQLVEHLQVPRELNLNPLFQVLFNLQHVSEDFHLGDLEVIPEERGDYLSRFDLLFNAFAKPDGLYLKVDYSKELFKEERIDALVDHYEAFIKVLLEDPSLRLSEHPFINEAEQAMLLSLNETTHPVDSDATLVKLLDAQASKSPQAVAVSFEGISLTYQELDERSNQLAHYLQSVGVSTEVPVAIAIDRSLEMIISILAVLKAGGCYVPLDSTSPSQRLRYILEDSGVRFALTHGDDFPDLSNTKCQLINLQQLDLTSEPVTRPEVPLSEGNLAYVIYTSGSTGHPKGVGVTHGNACSYLRWANQVYGSDHTKPVLFHGSICFDMSITSLFVPLLRGQEIVIKRDDFGKLLESDMSMEDYDFIKVTPSHLKLIAESGRSLENLSQCFVVGGEALTGEHLTSDTVDYYNEYGPTEATVGCSLYKVDPHQDYKNVPIGRPIWNTSLYILDSSHNLVIPGAIGELYIGGAGLARGYLNRPGLTAERFIPNPFGEPGSRLYRTGDLARYLEDGSIEYLGRSDDQVKIRGYRIELGEIEGTLDSSKSVQQSVVLCREDVPGQKRLVAYIVPKESGNDDVIPSLQSLCQKQLPEYMQPSQWVILDAFPLTTNGKIDRSALPAPEGREGLGEFEAPVGAVEQQLAAIWSDLLGLEDIGRHDNFFQIGGDSIVSIQLVSRARQAGLHFTVKQVFETPTVSGLAPRVRQETSQTISQEAAQGQVPLSPIQDWFFKADPHNPHHFNQAMWIQMKGPVDLDKLQDALQQIYAHHDAFRLRYRHSSEGWEQYYEDKVAPLPWTIHEGSEDHLSDVCSSYQSSLNIETGPLSHLIWFKDKGCFLWIIHHLIVDGVSWRILLEDLNQAYNGKTLGLKSHSYQTWVKSLQEYESPEALAYYEETLKDIPSLPVDTAYDGQVLLDEVKEIEVGLSEEVTTLFLQKAHQSYGTQANDLLLLSLVQAVGDCFGKYEVCVNLEGHGREDLGDGLDLTRTLGWFTSLHPVALRLASPDNLDESIKFVKEHLRGIPNKGASYGPLSRLQKKLPWVEGDIIFNYLGQWSDNRDGQNTFTFGNQDCGEGVSLENPHRAKLEVNCGISQGQFRFTWLYSDRHYAEQTMTRLTNAFTDRLKSLIEYCSTESNFGYTPSDFPLSCLTQTQIDSNLTQQHIQKVYPLSPIQEGFFLHNLYNSSTEAYFLQTVLELSGPLHIDVLKKTWSEIMSSHESLRASFLWEDMDEPVQVIHMLVHPDWVQEDWSGLSRSEQEKKLESFLQKDRSKGFDLTKAPLMRFALFKLAEGKYHFVWSHHHILSDGWSEGIILAEMSRYYESLVASNGQIYVPQRRPYSDYIQWLSEQDQIKSLGYWKSTLEGAAPTHLVRSTAMEDKQEDFEELVYSFSKENSEKLDAYAKKLGVTLNTVLQAIWGYVLSVYTGQNDVTIGVVVSGRQVDIPEIESMVGVFINTLPLRIKINPEESLEYLITRVREQMLNLQENSHVPLWKIQSNREHKENLFDTTYVYQNFPMQTNEGEETLKIEVLKGLEKGEYKLGINLAYTDALHARIYYNTAFFKDGYVEELKNHFAECVVKIIGNSNQCVGNVSILHNADINQLASWNQTEKQYPNTCFIHQMVEKHSRENPNQIAAIFGDLQLTYKELNEKSNQLANYLHQLGIEQEVPVAIAVDCSIDMLVSTLAILKAGGVYVPIDITYPPERINYMLDDCGTFFVLGRSKELRLISPGHRIIINLDDIELESQSSETLENNVSPDNLAYIIYTSGSTGLPKGVGVTHKALTHLAEVQRDAFSYTKETKTLQFASISFDASVSEMACTFAQGSTLVFCNNKDLLDVEETIAQHKVDQMTLPPSVLKEMSSEVISQNTNQIVIAGESPDKNLIQEYLDLGVKVINAYGPTEGTVCASIGTIESDIHIGQPIWNTQVYILDKYLNQLPKGLEGNIYIAGINLARGYINKPSLTAEKFIPNPFGLPGSRLYKTGDLGRYLDNGNIEYLGRSDTQIKIRGFRIELGEVEEVICSHRGIHQGVVLCREYIPGHKRLVAYVSFKQTKNDHELDALQDICKQRLPEYMCPNQWVVIDSLPLTPSGKVDRKTLANRNDLVEFEESSVYENSLQRSLCDIFTELVHATVKDIDRSFFELGGNSLLAVTLILKIKESLGVKLRITDIFEKSTVRKLGELITKQSLKSLDTESHDKSIFVIQSKGNQNPLFLIHQGLGFSLPYLPLKDYISDRPIIGIDDPYIGEMISGYDDLKSMASSYIRMLKNIQRKGPYYLGGYSFGGMVAFEMARQLESQGEEIETLMLIEAANPELLQKMTFNNEEDKLAFEAQEVRNVDLVRTYNAEPIKAKAYLIKAESALQELTSQCRQEFHESWYGWKGLCSSVEEFTIPGEHSTIVEADNYLPLGEIVKHIIEHK